MIYHARSLAPSLVRSCGVARLESVYYEDWPRHPFQPLPPISHHRLRVLFEFTEKEMEPRGCEVFHLSHYSVLEISNSVVPVGGCGRHEGQR